MKLTNPFRALDGLQVDDVLRSLNEKANAEKRIQALSDSYRALLTDPRYQLIRQDIENTLCEQLRLLVKEASKCHNCCKRAERIRLLDEVLHEPIQAVWYSNTQSRIAEDSNGDG